MANSEESSNFLNDVFGSTRDLITERFSSPFIFSYVVSWLLFNYKAIILILTDTSNLLVFETKINLIETYINNNYIGFPYHEDIQLNGFQWPLLAAFLYTFIYPIFDVIITKYTLFFKVAIRNLKVRAEGGLIHSHEYVEQIYLKHGRTEAYLNGRVESAEVRENDWRIQNEELKNKLNRLELDEVVRKKNETNTSRKSIGKETEIINSTNGAPIKKSRAKTSSNQSESATVDIDMEKLIDSLTKEELQGITVVGLIKMD